MTLRADQRPGYVNQIRGSVESISQVGPIETLTRSAELGDRWGFSKTRPELEGMLALISDLRHVSIDSLPLGTLTALTGALGSIGGLFNRMKTFDSGIHDATNQHSNLVSEILEAHGQLFSTIVPVLAYAKRDLTPLEQVRSDLNQLVDQATTQAQEIQKKNEEADAGLRRLEVAIEGAAKAASHAAVSEEEKHFRLEADEHKRAGFWWLVAVGTIVAAIVGLASYSARLALDTSTPDPTSVRGIQLGLAKLLIASALFSALVTAGRSYRAHRHNYVVNKHRLNALKTFRAFVAATGQDDKMRQAILLQTTTCIFTPQPTGFGSIREPDNAMPSIAELARLVVETRK